jgi:nicotinamidase/pyrazinamidase
VDRDLKEQGMININDSDALIIVDVQRDFCVGGALPVPDGDQVVPNLNRYIKLFDHARALIYTTRDWHPSNHISFKEYGGTWPRHCIQESEGAEFHPDLVLIPDVTIISKATTSDNDTYSGFDDTDLAESLRKNHVKRLFIGGLATDYCVKNTVLDALKLGFETFVLMDAIRGVNVQPNDSQNAIDEMISNSAQPITLQNVEQKNISIENTLEDKILERKSEKDKARTRTRGPYRKAWRS